MRRTEKEIKVKSLKMKLEKPPENSLKKQIKASVSKKI